MNMVTNAVPGLSKNLRPLFEREIELGNRVLRIDKPAGTKCPLAVILTNPLHFGELGPLAEELGSAVRRWENRDLHYPIEAGFVCQDTNQVLAGPLRVS